MGNFYSIFGACRRVAYETRPAQANREVTVTSGDTLNSILETTLVFGLAAAIAILLVATQQPFGSAWLEVVGPSRVLTLAFLISLCTCLIRAVATGWYVIGFAFLLSVIMSKFVPIEYWAAALFTYGIWLMIRRSAVAPTIIALGALGLHSALMMEQLPGVIHLALHMDTIIATSLIELSGRAVDVRGTALFVEEGFSLRLIGPCSSIWPMLTIIGAVGSILGGMQLGAVKHAHIVMVLAALTAIFLNGMRLAIMSSSNVAFEWLHAGSGAMIFRISLLAIIIVSFAFVILQRHPVNVTSIHKPKSI